MAFPAVVGTPTESNATSSDATPYTVSRPAGVGGQLTIVIIGVGGGVPTLTWPAGYTQFVTQDATGGNACIRAAYHWEDGTEGTTLDITSSSSQKWAAIVYSISGAAHPTVRAPESTVLDISTPTATPDCPAITPTGGAKDYLFIVAQACEGEEADDDTWGNSSPTNYTPSPPRQITSSTGGLATTNVSLETAELQLNASSEDPATFNNDLSRNGAAATIAVHPPAAVPNISNIGPPPQFNRTKVRAAAALIAAMPFVFSAPYISTSSTLATDQWGASFAAASTPLAQSAVSQPIRARRHRQYQTYFSPVDIPAAPPTVPDISSYQGQMPVRRKPLPVALVPSVFGVAFQTTSTLATDQWGASFAPAASIVYADFAGPNQRPRRAHRAHRSVFCPETLPPVPGEVQGAVSDPQPRRRRAYQETIFGPVEPPAAAPSVPVQPYFEATKPQVRRARAQQQSLFETVRDLLTPQPTFASERPRRKQRLNVGASVFAPPLDTSTPAATPFSDAKVSQPTYRKRTVANVPAYFGPVWAFEVPKTIQSTAHILEPPGIKEKTISSAAFIVKRRPISVAMSALAPERQRVVVEGPSKVSIPESV